MGPLLREAVPEAEHSPPLWTPCVGALPWPTTGRAAYSDGGPQVGGPSSDTPYRLNGNELSRNFDDRLNSNFHRFVILCICED